MEGIMLESKSLKTRRGILRLKRGEAVLLEKVIWPFKEKYFASPADKSWAETRDVIAIEEKDVIVTKL